MTGDEAQGHVPLPPTDDGPPGMFQSLVEQSLVGIYVIQKEGFVYVNPRLAEMFGYTPEEIVSGKTPADLTAEADRTIVAENIRRRLEGELPSARYAFQGLRRDGTLFDVEVHGSRTQFHGRPAIIGLALDITERRQSERALRGAHDDLERRVQERTADLSKANDDCTFLAEASRRLATTLDYRATLDHVVRLPIPYLADWCALDMLQPDQTLHRAAVAYGMPLQDAAPPEAGHGNAPRPGGAIATAASTGRPELMPEASGALLAEVVQEAGPPELQRALPGSSCMIVPVIARGRSLGTLAFVSARPEHTYGSRDLALAEDFAHGAALALENARLYREAQEEDRRKEEFLAMLGHELRNPLAPILNATHVLEKIGNDAPQAVEMRTIIRRQAQHLAQLLDDLLDTARIRSGRIVLQRQLLDLRDVARRSLESLRVAGLTADHTVSLVLGDEPALVEGDAVRLEQVVGNLVDNAVKYSPPGSPIAVGVEVAGGQGVVRVADRGAGIVPEMLPRIFEPFIQSEMALDRAHGGLGLGLSIVRNLVEKHGGTVIARSDGPGQGSEFVIRLPLAGEAPASRVEETLGPLPARHVLIVEDHRDSRETLRALLEGAGHRVTVAANGREGVEMAIAERPDIALIDLGLPVLDGYQVALSLRSRPEGKGMALIALTGYGQPEDMRRAIASGFDAHLVKPVAPGRLWRTIAQVSQDPAHGQDPGLRAAS